MALTEQIRRAAIKAGLMGMNGTSVATHKLEAFADYLLDEENEACAEVADALTKSSYLGKVGEEIRSRRKQ